MSDTGRSLNPMLFPMSKSSEYLGQSKQALLKFISLGDRS